MLSINKLGFLVALATVVIVVMAFFASVGFRRVFFPGKVSDVVGQPEERSALLGQLESQDQDGDGLNDLTEGIYRTDPAKADTDGDGMPDGEEVSLQRDPLVADSAASSEETPSTFTQQYLSQLPPNLPQEEVLSKDRLQAFVDANQGELLPQLPEGTIKTSAAAGKQAVDDYLNAISSAHNKNLHQITNADIDAAFRLHYVNSQPESLNDVITKLDQNIAALNNVVAPAEVKDLHTKLVAASQALAGNTRLLQQMSEDLVGGLIGAKNIEDLGAIFQEIGQQVKQLEDKYKIS